MVIDIHACPSFIREISADPGRVAFRRKHFGLYKQHVWPVELFLAQMDAAGIDKAVLLPDDLTSQHGGTLVSNDEVKFLVECCPDRFFGFASVDPGRGDALEALEHAFSDLHLEGLNLHPCLQQFYPDDEKMKPIYDLCLKYGKPVLFHSGLPCEPGSPMKYGYPLCFEDVLLSYPALRICLAHFAWPWVEIAAAMMLKYANLYVDTSLLYFDSPVEFFQHTFGSDIGSRWIDRTLRRQVMFGSNYPRIEQARMIKAVRSLDLRPETLDLVLGGNALSFMGMGAGA
jgi:uncharacterized protein